MELIAIRNLSCGYDRQIIVPSVNLTVRSGDYIGVIGPNGGGKTTLIKTLLGIIKPLGGTIEYPGDPVRIGYLPQAKTIDRQFPIDVMDTILSGLAGSKGYQSRYRNKDKLLAMGHMQQAGIAHLADENIGNLSGGQLQRVLICRALISEPSVLILDEPTNYVDNKFEHQLYDWLHTLNHRMVIIMVSHDLGTISSHVKSIACVNRGFHYHASNVITPEQLKSYDCPIQLIRHDEVPHTILPKHQ